MKPTNCIVTRCEYLERVNKRSGIHRCVHPDIPPKKTWKKNRGINTRMLKKCPKP